jgi:AcrR family transcriptional regulator
MESKRVRILTAAEEIMSLKGLTSSTISEIAQSAEVVESVIYQFYKGKEDLLLSIPGERMKEVLSLLEEQLQGIRDPESQLSKMIWFHLSYNDTHPGYARILLLECRSSRDFYQSPAYTLVKKYARILYGILQKGVQDGRFRRDLDIPLTRDIILGTLNEETITSLAREEIANTRPDFDDLMSLVYSMIMPKEQEETVNKGDRILLAAEKVFAEKGFTKARISEIAKLAEVAEGTVYDYFQNKEDLLLSIPTKRFEQYLRELPETFEIKNPVRKLRRFIKYHFLLFLTERDFLKVFLFQVLLNKRFYKSEAFENLNSYLKVIEAIVEEGKADGSFRGDVNPRVFRNMFFGAFSHLALRWVIIEKESQVDKMNELLRLTDLLTSAVIPNDPWANKKIERS